MRSMVISAIALAMAVCAGCGGSKPAEAPPPAEPEAPASSGAPSTEGAPASSAPAEESAPAPAAEPAGPVSIEVPIEAKSGSKLTGTATFSEEGDGVKVVISVSGVKPGQLATHVHEKGDCSAPDASSAGGHFNPDSHPHAKPPQTPRHLGDLGNITVSAKGTGTLELVVAGANLKPGDPHSFLDRALIVHEKKDDGGQPTGNAGGRIGCAVIKKS